MSIKTYSELMRIPDFLGRFEYLRLSGKVGDNTFGFDRFLNQSFYGSSEWKDYIRPKIITRDMGLDLGCKNHEITGIIIIHHINPITMDDIINRTDYLLNPEYMISTSDLTHRAIHYGDKSLLQNISVYSRSKNDTIPWRK